MRSMQRIASVLWLVLVVAAAARECLAVDAARACNSVIGRVSLHELEAIIRFTETAVPHGTSSVIYNNGTTLLLQYPVLVSKVCGSCRDVDDVAERASARRQQNNNNDWTTTASYYYCGDHTVGANVTHAALVFHPLLVDHNDNATTYHPLTGMRNGFVSFSSLSFTAGEHSTYSARFPANITDRLVGIDPKNNTLDDKALANMLVDVLPPLLAASFGLIAMVPDAWGTTGEESSSSSSSSSSSWHHGNAVGTALPVQQVAVVTWYATAVYTSALSNGCTQLGDQAMTWGYGAFGGAEAVWGTVALQQQSVDITRMFTQAAPYSNAYLVQSVVAKVLTAPDKNFTLSDMEMMLWVSLAASYSNEAPFLSNTGTGQTILAESHILHADNNASATVRYPADNVGFLNSIHPPVLNAVRKALGWVDPPASCVFNNKTLACRDASKAPTTCNPYDEMYGPDSECFASSSGEGTCYRAFCVQEDLTYRFLASGTFFTCEYDFQVIDIPITVTLIPHSVTCPQISQACPEFNLPTRLDRGDHFCQPEYLTNETDALCAALELNSPYSIWNETSNYSVEWCHSTNDTVIPFLMTQFYLLSLQLPNVVEYEPVYEFMQPVGDHQQAQVACNAALPTFLMDTMASADILTVVPIKADAMGGMCPGNTAIPTTAPSLPTSFPTFMPVNPLSVPPTSEPDVNASNLPTTTPGGNVSSAVPTNEPDQQPSVAPSTSAVGNLSAAGPTNAIDRESSALQMTSVLGTVATSLLLNAILAIFRS